MSYYIHTTVNDQEVAWEAQQAASKRLDHVKTLAATDHISVSFVGQKGKQWYMEKAINNQKNRFDRRDTAVARLRQKLIEKRLHGES